MTADQTVPPASAPEGSFESLREWLSSECRAFPISSSNVRVLSTPDEFYQTLLELSGRAEQRVVLSSLYLGTGPHEQALVAALQQRMQQRPDLRVDVLLDYLRGTRLVGEEKLSSVTALQPLLAQPIAPSSSPRVGLHLLQLPPPAVPHQISTLRGWVERRFFTGNKTREAVGVHHMKFYLFDDAVILSGANLSDTYFTNRQDRYVLIRDAKLANFYAQLLERLWGMPFCHTITNGGQADPAAVPAPRAPIDNAEEDAETRWGRRVQLGQQVMSLFQPRAEEKPAATKEVDTLIFPTLQLGTLGVTHDERITSGLFALRSPSSQQPAQLDVATGYMNLTEGYTSTLLRGDERGAPTPVRILAAAADANGWYGAKGGGRYVPDLYAAAAWELLQRTERAAQSERVQLLEWSRSGWSYHAKGAWLTLPGARAPQLSLIGSPNFGARSVQRDSETAIVMLTAADSPLARAFEQERTRVLAHCKRVTLDGRAAAGEGAGEGGLPVEAAVRPPLWLRALSKLARPYM